MAFGCVCWVVFRFSQVKNSKHPSAVLQTQLLRRMLFDQRDLLLITLAATCVILKLQQ